MILYTLPLNADHASSFLLCSLSIEGVTRSIVSTPRRSLPEDLSAAQSRGPNPGASATFSRDFFTGGLFGVGGRPSDDPDEGTDKEDAPNVRDSTTPGTRKALEGSGGGGISWVSVRTVGSSDEDVDEEGFGAAARR